jgi:hypothetical protein
MHTKRKGLAFAKTKQQKKKPTKQTNKKNPVK